MKKTIREWLDELPEPYKTQAIENANNYNEDVVANFSDTREDMYSALRAAFTWAHTPQGDDYWSEFYFSGQKSKHSDIKDESIDSLQVNYLRISLEDACKHYKSLSKKQFGLGLTQIEQEFLDLILSNFDVKDLEEKKGYSWEESFSRNGFYLINDSVMLFSSISDSAGNKCIFRSKNEALSALAFAQLTHIVAKYNEWKDVPKELFYVGEELLTNPSNKLCVFSSQLGSHFLPFYTKEDAEVSMEVNADLWKQYWMID